MTSISKLINTLIPEESNSVIISIVIGIVICFLPLVLSTYGLRILTEILIWAIFAMSFDLMLGYLGLISFGHSAFWGLGAFTVGILHTKGMVFDFSLMIICVGLVSIAIGVIFGLLAMRTTDIYFTLVTLALSQSLFVICAKWESLTGGVQGIPGITLPLGLGEKGYFYLVFIIYGICFSIIRWVCSARYGRVLIGVRENPLRMEAMGYNIWAAKLLCFIVAGIFGSVAGAMAAYHNSLVSVDDFSFFITGTTILMVLIGGMANPIGCLIGSAFVTILYRIVSTYADHCQLIVGLIFVAIVLFARQGLVGYFDSLLKRAHYGSIKN